MVISDLTSLPCLSKKSSDAVCFSLENGRSAMACFLISRGEYDMEVMITEVMNRLSYGYGTDTLIQY